jgi:transposase
LCAHLVFLDESGFLLIPPVQRTWAPKGRTPVLRHSYRRDRLSVIGGLSMSPIRQRLGLYFQIYPWNVTAVELVQYFAELLRHLRGEVIVLLDGWAVHKDRKVAQFCRGHRRLQLERFPAYAPELNPEEYVWTQAKRAVSNTCPENQDDLLDLVVDALCDVQQSQTLLGACLAHAAKHGLVWNE